MEAVKPIPTAAELEAAERQRVKDLKQYREDHPKRWFMKR